MADNYFKQPIITKQAENEVNFALAGNLPVTFTRMSLGNGRHLTDIEDKQDVLNPIMSITVNQMPERSSNQTRIIGTLDNQRLMIMQRLFVNEIGVFAKVGNRDEFMFMYTSADEGDIIPPATESHILRDYVFTTIISTEGELTVNYMVGDSIYALYDDLMEVDDKLAGHIANKNNPHAVTKAQVGLNNVINEVQAKKTDFDTHTKDRNNPHGVTKEQVNLGNVDNVRQATKTEFDSHAGNKKNPHGVTKTQVGLSNVDNFKTATMQDAVAGTANDKFMTPATAKRSAEVWGSSYDSGVSQGGGHFLKFDEGTQFVWETRKYNSSTVPKRWDLPASFKDARNIMFRYNLSYDHNNPLQPLTDNYREELVNFSGFLEIGLAREQEGVVITKDHITLNGIHDKTTSYYGSFPNATDSVTISLWAIGLWK